jgi:SAM-dependent methyltransferase
VLWCDTPSLDDGAEIQLPARVSGWAHSKAGIDRVLIAIDGAVALRARHGLYRSDVAAALDDEAAATSAYTTLLHESVCPVVEHELSVVAVSKDGQAVGYRATIVVVPNLESDFPSASSGSAGVPAERLDGGGERFVPELHGGGMIHAEHETRYGWAAQLAADRDVLDAGCGVGWGTMRLLDAGARSAVGVDLDELALRSARERAGGAAEFVQGNLLDLPFQDDSFDLVVCFEAIEHVENPGLALDELRRVLGPGGVLAVSSPNRGVYPAGNPFHLRELGSHELEAGLRQRFAEVAMYRQQTHLGSLLTDDIGDATDDATVTIDAQLRKVVAGQPGQELYTVALAADIAIPPMHGVALLAEPLDVSELFEAVFALEHRAAVAEAEARASNTEVVAAEFRNEQLLALLDQTEQARAEAEHWLAEHRSSPSWRITAPLRAVKRAALAWLRGRRAGR